MEKIDNYVRNQSLTVGIGAKVEIEVNGKPQSWEVVGANESDIPSGKISIKAPLIQLILGKKKGDVIRNRIVGENIEILIKGVQ